MKTLSLQHAQAAQTLSLILANVFNYPDEDFTGSMRRGAFCTQLRDCCDVLGLADLAQPLADIDAYLAGTATLEECQLDLEKEYTWLFFASKPRAVYIFESVYSEGKLMRDSTFAVARMYHQAGLNIVASMKLPPDHMAVELEFLAYLLFNEASALNNDENDKLELARSMRQELLHTHLGPFSASFCQRLKDKARMPFYRSMAHLLEKLIPTLA